MKHLSFSTLVQYYYTLVRKETYTRCPKAINWRTQVIHHLLRSRTTSPPLIYWLEMLFTAFILSSCLVFSRVQAQRNITVNETDSAITVRTPTSSYPSSNHPFLVCRSRRRSHLPVRHQRNPSRRPTRLLQRPTLQLHRTRRNVPKRLRLRYVQIHRYRDLSHPHPHPLPRPLADSSFPHP